MEYRKIMDASKKTYAEYYEDLITQYSEELGIPPELQAILKAKRDYGLNKYKEYSFQSSFENTITTPIVQHLREELVDALNYCLHARLVFSIKSPDQLLALEDITREVLKSLQTANRLREDLQTTAAQRVTNTLFEKGFFTSSK